MEEFGSFEMNGSVSSSAECFRSELNLLLTCAFWSIFGNSVHYEFGYRWFNQTQYSDKFKREYLEFLDVQPFPVSAQEFMREADDACVISTREVASAAISNNPDSSRAQMLGDLSSAIEIDSDISGQSLNEGAAVVENTIARVVSFGKSRGTDLGLDNLGRAFSGSVLQRLIPARGPHKQVVFRTDGFTHFLKKWSKVHGAFVDRSAGNSEYSPFQGSQYGGDHTDAPFGIPSPRVVFDPGISLSDPQPVESVKGTRTRRISFSVECSVPEGSVLSDFSIHVSCLSNGSATLKETV
jgi:hypothetical protein